MVASPVAPNVSTPSTTPDQSIVSLADFVAHPLDGLEWVDGQLVEKVGTTIKHGVVQARLSRFWGNYVDAQGLGGEVCTEAPCQTKNQVRRPDIAYITPQLLNQFGQPATFPQSFPLIAEIASPTDDIEAFFRKTQEYLDSGCEEVWMLLPENQWVFVITSTQHLWFTADQVISTQIALKGFSIQVSDLLA